MTTDESIMEEMLDRATNPAKDSVDELGVQMFCIVVRSNAQLVNKAQEMIVAKVHSANINVATRAIGLLEECMTQCGADFQDEAGKYRFLNELIRLVSKKYQGAETPIEVKQRIMECLLLWTTEFPQRHKIRDAYDMLRKEDIEHGQSPAAVAKRESVLGTMDEAMFAKLIKSNDPENFKRANLLLQYRMAQEARHNDLLSQHRCVLQEVQNTMQLLNQMLDTYDPSDVDVNETIHELYKSCEKHKPIFQRLPELLGESDAQLIADTLEANGILLALITRYQELVQAPEPAATQQHVVATRSSSSNSSSSTNTNNNALLLNELLGGSLTATASTAAVSTTPTATTTTTTTLTTSKKSAGDALADLSEIFSSALAESEASKQQGTTEPPFLQHSELLEPQVLSNVSAELPNGTARAAGDDAAKRPSGPNRDMPQIDLLSEKLFQQILPAQQERVASFKRDPEKLTLNDLARERMQPKPAATPASELLDDVPLLCAAEAPAKTEPRIAAEKVSTTPTPTAAPPIAAPIAAIKHLSEIVIDLDNITATAEQRVVLDDDDLQLSLNFTEDRPSRQVAVIVITAQNKSKQPVKDFQFEASVKKPCKVRLLPPTSNEMPAHKPFRPATPINQVMLLLNPTGQSVDVTCIVGYRLGDDPDPIKESIVATGIAYVE